MYDKKEKGTFDKDSLRKLQLKSLNLLLDFKKICDDNNLLFYFCGGCCIGALRNKGFIPWDDDIDVFMPRKDYEKLGEIWNKCADTDKYSYIRTNKEMFAGNIFTTIVDNNTTFIRPNQVNLDIPKGIAIDVFPLDGCPSSRFSRKMQKFWALIYSLYLAQIIPENHGKMIYIIAKFMLWMAPSKKFRFKIWKFAEKHMSKYKIGDCEFITELCAGPGYMQNEYPKRDFEKAVYKDFEGYMLPIPVGYHDYLSIAFGDYMTPPPKEKQIAHHDVIFYDLDNSYKKYEGLTAEELQKLPNKN